VHARAKAGQALVENGGAITDWTGFSTR
jgi:hypothetical protein